MIIVFNFTYNSNCSKESSEEEKMKKTYKKEKKGGHLQKNFLTFKNTQMMQRYMMISFQK